MKVLIVRFRLQGVDHEMYVATAEQLASEIARSPGLVTKWWVDGAETGTYGGVYLFTDQQAIEQYLASPTIAGFVSSGVPVDLQTEVLDVLAAATAITAGPLAGSFPVKAAA
ncbi:MAG: YdhR family protein [Thermomicrobiales bacterium]|nr:YdhR family protein [Thermomicrobiales bacterium]